MKNIFPALVVCVCLVGCDAQKKMAHQKAMDSWMGATRTALYQSWGPPTKVTSDGNGGEIAAYYYTSTTSTPGQAYSNGWGGISYTAPTQQQNVAYRMFYINAAGKIYYWRSQD